MKDPIERQGVIDAIKAIPDGNWSSKRYVTAIKELPSAQQEVTEEEVKEYCRKRCLSIIDSALLKKYASAQPEQTDCDYCHEDSDGYVKPIEKNGHAFVRFGNGYNAGFEAGQRDLMLEKLPAAQPSFSQPHENDHSADDSKKAVQPEPCEDTISRKAAIKCCTFGRTSLGLIDELRRLPSVTPEQRWIPCNDRLPEDGERVLATHLGGLNPDRQVIEHIYKNEEFTLGWDMDMNKDSPTFGQRYMGKVVAWMPLPEPYGGEQE